MAPLKRVFEGGDRSYMHEEIHRYFREARSGVSETKKSDYYDRMVADLVREDPSLMTDPLSLNFGPPVWELKDGRRTQTRTSGTWCMFAAAMPFPHTLAAAFKAGVNPDEPDVFMNGGLLSYRHWFKTPALLELALKYGANPDVEVQHAPNKDTGSPGQVLRSSLQTARYGKESERLSDIQAIATLLRAGARRIGHVDDESRPGTLTHHASAAWLLAAASERTTAVVQDAMAGLVPLLRANGLDIDSPYMSAGTAPIVEAARARNRPMVEAFIQVGARTDDEHIAREARSSHVAVLSLHEEVEKAFGVEGVAWLTAALMSQRIGEIAQAESAPESRRRLRVI